MYERPSCKVKRKLTFFLIYEIKITIFTIIIQQKVFSLISSRDHCQRRSPLQPYSTSLPVFEIVQNLSSGFDEWRRCLKCVSNFWLQKHATIVGVPLNEHAISSNMTTVSKYSFSYNQEMQVDLSNEKRMGIKQSKIFHEITYTDAQLDNTTCVLGCLYLSYDFLINPLILCLISCLLFMVPWLYSVL